MNVHELSLIETQHDKTFMAVFKIISTYIKKMPSEMKKELEDYNEGFKYAIGACIEGQLDETETIDVIGK